MSWESIVWDMIEEENPDLHAELLDDGGYEDYVADVTQRDGLPRTTAMAAGAGKAPAARRPGGGAAHPNRRR